MPLGSSSDAPVIRPGPITRRQSSFRRLPGRLLAVGLIGLASGSVDMAASTAVADEGCVGGTSRAKPALDGPHPHDRDRIPHYRSRGGVAAGDGKAADLYLRNGRAVGQSG